MNNTQDSKNRIYTKFRKDKKIFIYFWIILLVRVNFFFFFNKKNNNNFAIKLSLFW